MDQGWLLVILTSGITFLGCCTIYIDVIYKFLFPKRAAIKPFNIAHDSEFLVCALALSSGSLLFTSLYKLLPKSHSNLKHVEWLKHSPMLLKLVEYSCYFLGIAICSVLNVIIHLFTNESLVHCAHDGVDHGHEESAAENTHSHSHDHSHDHSHNQTHDHNNGATSLSIAPPDAHSIPQHHSHANSPSDPPPEYHLQINTAPESCIPEPSTKLDNAHHFVCPHSPTQAEEDKQNQPRRMMSFVDLSLKTLKGETFTGRCYGDLDCCVDFLTHSHKNKELHFCSRPTDENALFIDNDNKKMITDRTALLKKYPTFEITSPLISRDVSPHRNHTSYGSIVNTANSNASQANQITQHQHQHQHQHQQSNHPYDTDDNADFEGSEFDSDLENNEHADHHVDHHHHIKTPLSRLLSIGVQTVLAISLHKFPEGFIMYSTSKTEPELGMSIFLSMFIHNFVEGFTMTLPIYIALDSRLKAILISGTLGSFSQPIGAVIGYLMFRGDLDENSQYTALLIASLLAITSGFLTFISLQMFASAIGFGGKQESVMKWCFFGILLIAFSNLLITN